jgi:hypothetical protein
MNEELDLKPRAGMPVDVVRLNEAVASLGTRVKARSVQRNIEKAQDPVQLPIWADDLRGMPNSFARGALFTAGKTDSNETRAFLKGVEVASLNGVSIEYRGEELRQDDCSVFLAILHFGRKHELGTPIPFTAYSMLKELGWSTNSVEYNHLRECCERLQATGIKVSHDKGGAGYAGSLIRSFAWKDERGDKLSNWVVLLEKDIADLFAQPFFTLLDPAERKAIGGRSPLAQWLHMFLCTHREPFAISVKKYHELSASRTANINDFRRRLKIALQRLKEVGFLKDFEIKADLVHVKRVPKNYPAPVQGTAGEQVAALA